MLDGMDRVARNADRIAVPVLALHGEADRVCSVEPVRELLGRVATTDTTLRTFPRGLHGMLHDYEKEDVLFALWEWLSTRL
jgi:alpha-beta hydrolase superfamily lysophospholipase